MALAPEGGKDPKSECPVQDIAPALCRTVIPEALTLSGGQVVAFCIELGPGQGRTKFLAKVSL